jgi:hypothetical protein
VQAGLQERNSHEDAHRQPEQARRGIAEQKPCERRTLDLNLGCAGQVALEEEHHHQQDEGDPEDPDDRGMETVEYALELWHHQ